MKIANADPPYLGYANRYPERRFASGFLNYLELEKKMNSLIYSLAQELLADVGNRGVKPSAIARRS